MGQSAAKTSASQPGTGNSRQLDVAEPSPSPSRPRQRRYSTIRSSGKATAGARKAAQSRVFPPAFGPTAQARRRARTKAAAVNRFGNAVGARIARNNGQHQGRQEGAQEPLGAGRGKKPGADACAQDQAQHGSGASLEASKPENVPADLAFRNGQFSAAYLAQVVRGRSSRVR